MLTVEGFIENAAFANGLTICSSVKYPKSPPVSELPGSSEFAFAIAANFDGSLLTSARIVSAFAFFSFISFLTCSSIASGVKSLESSFDVIISLILSGSALIRICDALTLSGYLNLSILLL